MITIVIASANKELLNDVKVNIDQTIGVAYEVLAFDNSDGQRSICSIYNEAVRKAGFDILCFMHEDVAFNTPDWGKIVQNLFAENQRLGVLGIAGSTYKSFTPSGWLSHNRLMETEYSNLIQGHKYAGTHTVHHRRNEDEQNPARVATVDGVWMCVKKDVARRFPFDEITFAGFHCYDIDFCLSVGRTHTIDVTFDVLLHHYSDGNFDGQWLKETIKLHQKWRDLLPVYTKPFTKQQILTIEEHNFGFFIGRLAHFGFPSKIAYELLWQGGYLQKFGLRKFIRFYRQIGKTFRRSLN